MKQVSHALVKGKRVMVRFNGDVPVTHGDVSSESLFRLKSVVETVKYLRKKGAEVVLVTHRGRPRHRDMELSTRALLHPLSKLLHTRVLFTEMPPQGVVRVGRVYLCENLRFLKGEVEGSKEFAREYTRQSDVFVQDAFSVCHRTDASMAQFPRVLPAYAGFAVQKELAALSPIVSKRAITGFVAIVGGIKLETKLPLIEALLERGATVLLGSALVIPWMQLQKFHRRVIMPLDVRVFRKNRAVSVSLVDARKQKEVFLDIGPQTERLYAEYIAQAKTVLWNGPLGNNEDYRFSRGTRAIIGACKKTRAKTIVGGGETVAAVIASRATLYFDHVSTGGGALLTYVAGGDMPGLSVL